MDKLSRLQALTGDEGVVHQDKSAEINWHPKVQASNVYEGTDSEDDAVIMSRGRIKGQHNAGSISTQGGKNRVNTTTTFGFELKKGQLAPEGVKFMTFKTATKYPYMFIGHGNRQKVAENFFDKNQIYGHTYDLFYLYPEESTFSQPVILIPSKQFERLLAAINLKLKTKLTIPKGPAGDAFYIGFWADGNAQPRYLGRSSTKETFDDLKAGMPPYWHKHDAEPTTAGPPDKSSLAAYKEKVALMTANEKGKKGANKVKKAEDQIKRHQSWRGTVKCVECYIGIREDRDFEAIINAQQRASSSGQWIDMKAETARLAREATEKYGPSTCFDPAKGTKFKPKDSVVFISIDVEAYEFNHKQITEIGVATLDTLDLVNAAAGVGGMSWMNEIRARHFRIQENRFLVNKVHVSGCPDSFEFGESEFINMKDAPSVIASCFKHPFSGTNTPEDENNSKRNIVLVGHAVGGDVTFLKDLGYDVTNLSNLIDVVDTADMWKYLKKETNPAKLGVILHDLGMVMIGLAIKHIVQKGKPQFQGLNVATTAGTVQGWESGDDEETSIVPTVYKNAVPFEEKAMSSVTNKTGDEIGKSVISLPADHNEGGNEVDNSMALLSLDEALRASYRPIVTADGSINLVMVPPSEDELDLVKPKNNVGPRQVSPSIQTPRDQGTGNNSLPTDDRKTASTTELDYYDPLNQPWTT